MQQRHLASVLLVLSGSVVVAQPVPPAVRSGDLLVADSTLDTVFLTRDLTGDGDARDAGETTVFFGPGNASGFASPVGNPSSIFQSVDGTIFIADTTSDTVYRLRDMNGDGDAMDAGEAIVWFADTVNSLGLALPTPNGLWQDDDGFTYIVNAGTGASPSDAVYRTMDRNGDGDALDADEATLWFDLQTLVASSSAFNIAFIGPVAYITDLRGGLPDAILRARDADLNGVISADEFTVLIDDGHVSGVQISICLAADGVAVYTGENTSSADQNIWRIRDVNDDGVIDAEDEVAPVWNESMTPAGFDQGSMFDIAFGPDATLAVTSGGATTSDNVWLLSEFALPGGFTATTHWSDGGAGTGDFLDNPRAVRFLRPAADTDNNGAVDVFDLLTFLADWFDDAGLADWNWSGTTDVFDLLLFLTAWFG